VTTPPQLTTLPNSFETLGLVIDFLSKLEPFSGHSLGPLCAAIRVQLRHKHNFAVIENRKLRGYLGWLPTSIETAEKWLESDAILIPILDGETDAAALTIVAAADHAATRLLIRAARNHAPGKRIYFKREDSSGIGSRKSTVLNV
jgi:hypothetical protein